MLNGRPAPASLLLLGMAALVALGCRHIVEPIYKIEDLRSEENRLVLRNDTQLPLAVLPAPDARGGPLPLPPGSRAAIAFRVFRLNDIERSPHGWFQRKPGATISVVDPADPARYIDMAGVDAAILIGVEGGMRWTFVVQLGECWFKSPPPPEGVLLAITGPPTAGVPAVPCP